MAEEKPVAERLIDAMISFQEKMWPEVKSNLLKQAEGRKAVIYISGPDGAVITCEFAGSRFRKTQDGKDARNFIETDLQCFLELILRKTSMAEAIWHKRVKIKTPDGRIATSDMQFFQEAWKILMQTAAAMRLSDRIGIMMKA